MSDIKISQLPVASVVNDGDIAVINQGGETKTAARSLIVAGLATTDQISAFATTSQVESIASAQIAAITPASIGAFATSAIIAIENGGTGATDAPSALAALGGITSAQVPAFDTAQLSAYVQKAGDTMQGRLIMAATTDQAKANIGGALTGVAAPASSIAGDVWISNQSKLTFSPTTGTAITLAGLSQQNTFNQQQTIGSATAATGLIVSNTSTGRAATFAANSTAPAVAITQSGTGAALSVDSKGILFYDGSLQSTATGHYQARYASTVNHAGTSNTGVTPNTFTYETFGLPQCDSRNIALNDLLVFTAQADQKQNGPWIVTTMNVSGVSGAILTRPTWFSGNAIKQGITLNIGDGQTRSGQILSVTKATNGLIAVGGDNLTIIVVNYNQNTVQQSQISGLATTAQLGGYATTSQIEGIAFTSQLAAFTNSAQVEALASAQIAAITPTSIGAFATSDVIAITNGGTGSTSAAAALTALGALSATAAAGGDLSGNYPDPTVAKIQGQAVSSAAPGTGQVLTWNGTTWIATAPAAGGSGGGGVLFYFNYGTNPDAPAPVGAKELGRTAEVTLSSITTPTLTTGVWTDVAGFVSDTLDPNLEFLPAGIFDFNVWCAGTANVNAPTVLRVEVNKWDGTTSTNIATSGNAVVPNNGTPLQTAISLVIPQTDITPADRLYIVIQVQASGAGHTVTVDFGDGAPSHVHTTIPSVGGTGVLKLINGVPQNPASFIIDADIATDAAIALSKVQMSQISVLTGDGLVGGGDLSTSRTLALATTGISAITVGSSAAVPVITANVYGQITALTTEAIPFNAGTVTSITAGTGLTGGTITSDGIIALETAGPGVLTNVGSSAAVPVISVDAYGRISALETASIAELGVGTVTSIAMTSQVSGLSFTPTTAITDNGTFNLTGVLDISNGGTGATDAVAALSNLGGITTDALSGYASTSQLAGLQPALTTAAPLGIELGGTGATTAIGALTNLGSLHFAGGWSQTSVITGTMDTGVTPNTFTVTATGALSVDAGAPIAGNVVVFTSQPTGSQHFGRDNGPWVVVNPGAVGVQATFVRPDWFSGTVKTGILVTNQFGSTRTGVTYAIQGPNAPTSGDFISVGTDILNVYTAYQRVGNAGTASNTFSSRQTFSASSSSTTVNPITFSTSSPVLLSTRQLGAIEWDNQQLYITSSTQFALLNRNPIATATVLINQQTGTSYTPGLTDAGKLITASNAAAISLTIPTDATVDFPVGTQLIVMQLAAGQVTVSAVTPGTTSVNSKNGTKTSGQYAVISLIKVAANSWVVGGDATT
jgi:hypothetical protein